MGKAVIARRPYLQRVTAHDAVVVWTASGGTGGVVVVTTPAGAPIAEAPAALDAPSLLVGGLSQWTAAMDGLSAATTYCYEVRRGGETLVRGGTLASAPAPGTGARVRALVIGDSGEGGSDQQALAAQLDTLPFDLMIHTGDIAYDNGALDDFESKFFGVYAPLLGRAPVFPASGNHEYGTADAAPFRAVFVLPETGGRAGASAGTRTTGGTSTSSCSTPNGPARSRRTGWKRIWPPIASPGPSSTGTGRPTPPASTATTAPSGRFFVPLLERHHVDLVLSGHDHHYERFTPQNGVSYVVSGGGGKGTRSAAAGLSPRLSRT